MIRITNKSEYPTREVNRLVRRALGYLDITDGIKVDVLHFQKKKAGAERTWMGGWYHGSGARRITAKIVRPGFDPYPYVPYHRTREGGRKFQPADWREQLVALVAHEAMHHKQYLNRLPYREVDCDLAAYRAVQYLREDEGRA